MATWPARGIGGMSLAESTGAAAVAMRVAPAFSHAAKPQHRECTTMTTTSQPKDTAPHVEPRESAASPERRGPISAEQPGRASHAPGGGELDSIPDDQARKVVPDDPRQTEARDPAGKPWPDGHDAPDDSGNRPRPL